MKVLNSLAVSGALTVAGNAVWHAGNLDPASFAAVNHTHSGYATAAQGTKADNALPATSYTAADVLAKLLAVDTDSAGNQGRQCPTRDQLYGCGCACKIADC